MKKAFAMFLALALLLTAFAGCGSKQDAPAAGNNSQAAASGGKSAKSDLVIAIKGDIKQIGYAQNGRMVASLCAPTLFIQTIHRYDNQTTSLYNGIRQQIRQGRQVYIVFPLIKESEKSDLKNLEEGFETLKEAFPEFQLSKVHGKMKPAEKEAEMELFVKGETQILVATTVIEVGVNVPNASVMVILYELQTDTISRIDNMIKPHSYHSIEYIENYDCFVVIGGEKNKYCEIFDLFTNKWIQDYLM